MNSNSKNMKIELLGAAATLLISAVALVSAAYAWYVANNTVTAETSTISATTNGFILQIADRESGAQHGGNEKSLEASTVGNRIAPSSTDNIKDWFVCRSWDEQGRVTSYDQVSFANDPDAKDGEYHSGGKKLFAYSKSEFIIYTITHTGKADVFLDGSSGEPVEVFVDNGVTPNSDTIKDSMRVGITVQPLGDDGKTPIEEERLRVVYAPSKVSGKGNDSSAIADKWTCIYNNTLREVGYPHIDSSSKVDQNGKNWIATKSGENYTVSEGTEKIASNVGYNGMLLRVYIWMEGTDADCVNNAVEEDAATYSVSVKFAGIQAN